MKQPEIYKIEDDLHELRFMGKMGKCESAKIPGWF